MSFFLLWLSVALDLGVLAGLVVRRRVAEAYTLPVLLLALAATATTVGLCLACNTWDFALTKELIHAVLFLLLGLELAWRLFPGLPVARRTAQLWFVLMLVAMLVWLLTAPAGPRMIQTLPRIIGTGACLYMGLTVLMHLFRVDIGPLRNALLSALSPYAILYAVTWHYHGQDASVANVVNPLAFDIAMALVLRAAWQREQHTSVPLVLTRLIGA